MNNEQKQLTPSETVDALRMAYNLIVAATKSRHVAFTSPSPSSTESVVRKNVIHVKNILDITLSILKA